MRFLSLLLLIDWSGFYISVMEKSLPVEQLDAIIFLAAKHPLLF